MKGPTVLPKITALRWLDVRVVLANEAQHFTPWLASNLELLADAIGLEELTQIATEYSVGEFRLDIRAVGVDAAGSTYAVAIENQYGLSNHDHLGKLITYAAHAYEEPDVDRVISVWLTEQVREPHLAAIEFLNRTSPGDIGYFLVSPRFVAGPDGGYFVHFEVLAEPNEFLKSAVGPTTPISTERQIFMQAMYDLCHQRVKGAGYRHTWVHPDGRLARLYLPHDHPLANWAEIRLFSTRTQFRCVLCVENKDASPEESSAILDLVRFQHSDEFEVELGATLNWGGNGALVAGRSATAKVEYPGMGYLDGDPSAAADAAVRFAEVVLRVTRDDDPELYPEPSGEGAVHADAATVATIVGLIRPGEWATYGDISEVAVGSKAASMAVGNILATNQAIPHPHRVLASGGRIPKGWLSHDGLGPEECARRLSEEGVGTVNGSATPAARVSANVLRQRRTAT